MSLKLFYQYLIQEGPIAKLISGFFNYAKLKFETKIDQKFRKTVRNTVLYQELNPSSLNI